MISMSVNSDVDIIRHAYENDSNIDGIVVCRFDK